MFSCGLNADMKSLQTYAPLINAIINNVQFHINSRINRMLPQIVHILCNICLVVSLPEILVVN